jgi:hypothetical protein
LSRTSTNKTQRFAGIDDVDGDEAARNRRADRDLTAAVSLMADVEAPPADPPELTAAELQAAELHWKRSAMRCQLATMPPSTGEQRIAASRSGFVERSRDQASLTFARRRYANGTVIACLTHVRIPSSHELSTDPPTKG